MSDSGSLEEKKPPTVSDSYIVAHLTWVWLLHLVMALNGEANENSTQAIVISKAYTISLHEGVMFSRHSINCTGSVAVYFITLTTRQALVYLA